MNKLIILAMCFILSGITLCSAEPLRESGPELGVEISSFKYEEPGIMSDEGILFGIAGSYFNHEGSTNMFGGVEGRLAWGLVDYDGRLSDDTPYKMNDINDYIFEGRILGGYDYVLVKDTVMSPYVGLGYRYLNDNSQKDIYGYQRESNYLYSPIGIDAVTDLGNGWSIGVVAEYDLFWYGLQKSHLGDVYPDVNVVENDQWEGYGARGSIRIKRKAEKMDFIIEPFIRYWDIEKSDTTAVTLTGGYVIGFGYEPKNDTTEYGIRLAARF